MYLQVALLMILGIVPVQNGANVCPLATFKGGWNSIEGVAFSPDGKTLASGSLDHSLKLWDVTTHRERRPQMFDGLIHSLAFSPDGRIIAVGLFKQVAVVDAKIGKEAATFKGHEAAVARQDTSVTSVAFTRDGKWLATGSLESEVRVWEIATGRECFTMKHGGPVNSVAFSPDGTLLASGSDENTVKRWSLKKRKSQ